MVKIMTERFHKAYCCGDTGVVDELENEWFIENINSISDLEKNWDIVIDKLNQVAEENEKLKEELESFEQVNFTDLCDGSRTVLYMKKENGDSE